MTKTKVNGKEVELHFNMRGLRDFGGAIGADTPTEAGQKIASISTSSKGITFESFDIVANLIYVMADRGGGLGDLTLDDCYEAVNDADAIQAMLKELETFLPQSETVKKKKEQHPKPEVI